MTATDELRRLLDERGVEFKTHDIITGKAVTWHGSICDWVALPDERGLAVGVYKDYLTPEQAIAATLGRGTCHPDRRGKCSNCGKQIGVVRNCEMYIACDGQQAWKSLDHEVCDVPNYCPHCGCEVER